MSVINNNNPYISRGPVRSPEMFFGREQELQELAAFLGGNQSVSIVGPRKIGKTSLLFHLMRPETRAALGMGSGNVLTYLDCEVLGESGIEEIFGQFANEITLTLEDMGLPGEPALEKVAEKPTRLSFETALRKLNQRGLRVVLILDEFERLSTNPHLDLNFFNALRSAAGRYQLAFVTASARPLIELTYAEKSQEVLSSPFFNIFAPLFLSLLSEQDARALIEVPSRQAGVAFSPGMVEAIYRLVGGHPLALQVACFHAMHAVDDITEIKQHTLRELDAHFQYYWRNLTPIEQDSLRHVGEVAARADSDTTLRAALRDLVLKGLLVAENDNYRCPSEAWSEFVAAQGVTPSTTSRVSNVLTGTQIGAYEVLEMIGRGGMSEVYKGRHTRLARTVAIKVLSPNLAAEADFRRRFEREARSIASLKHPNIVGVFDFGDADGLYYMVMEFVAGQTLTHLLRQRGPLSLADTRCLVRDLAAALDYAHAQGIVHRDVKPSNMMLEPMTTSEYNSFGMRTVLTDFGIAKLLRGTTGGTQTEGLTGTLDYMAPEQIRISRDLDGRADVYALGVVLFQVLTGKLPFEASNPAALMMAHLQEPPPDPRSLKPDLPKSVAGAILAALAKDPRDRMPTAGLLLEAIL